MNPELYTEEFRNFKFLKSSPEAVAYFKASREAINKIQPWNSRYDPEFHWPCRIEFIEQVLDLRYDVLYIVAPGQMNIYNFDYESANILELKHPTIFNEYPISSLHAREITIEDIPQIEIIGNKNFWLCENIGPVPEGVCKLHKLPIQPGADSDFNELFFDRVAAEEYRKELTNLLRNKLSTLLPRE